MGVTSVEMLEGKQTTTSERCYSAASLAGEAILLEIGDGYGVIDPIRQSKRFTSADLARISNLPRSVIESYVEALESAGLVVKAEEDRSAFQVSEFFDEVVHDVGY